MAKNTTKGVTTVNNICFQIFFCLINVYFLIIFILQILSKLFRNILNISAILAHPHNVEPDEADIIRIRNSEIHIHNRNWYNHHQIYRNKQKNKNSSRGNLPAQIVMKESIKVEGSANGDFPVYPGAYPGQFSVKMSEIPDRVSWDSSKILKR